MPIIDVPEAPDLSDTAPPDENCEIVASPLRPKAARPSTNRTMGVRCGVGKVPRIGVWLPSPLPVSWVPPGVSNRHDLNVR
jgi:hypothetical protein